jgi:hypothetical protein
VVGAWLLSASQLDAADEELDMMHELGMPHHMGFGLGAASDDELGARAHAHPSSAFMVSQHHYSTSKNWNSVLKLLRTIVYSLLAYIKFCTVCS